MNNRCPTNLDARQNEYTYDPWGDPLSASETVENPYRYASYRYDAESGLYDCWNRAYAPALGRFLQRDLVPGVLERPASMNPYAYCEGDPVNAVDPSGTITELGLLAIVLVVVVVGGALVGMIAGSNKKDLARREDAWADDSGGATTPQGDLEEYERSRDCMGPALKRAQVAGELAGYATPDPTDLAGEMVLSAWQSEAESRAVAPPHELMWWERLANWASGAEVYKGSRSHVENGAG